MIESAKIREPIAGWRPQLIQRVLRLRPTGFQGRAVALRGNGGTHLDRFFGTQAESLLKPWPLNRLATGVSAQRRENVGVLDLARKDVRRRLLTPSAARLARPLACDILRP